MGSESKIYVRDKMSDPYYPYGNNYHGGYRNNSYGNNQNNDSRYMQYSQGHSRRDYDNRQWNNSPQSNQWQAIPYQQRGGYYDNSGYMRQDDRRNRHSDNRGHDNRGQDNRGYNNRSHDNRSHDNRGHSRHSSKYLDPDYQPSTQRDSIFQSAQEASPLPVITPPAMTYNTPENSAMSHGGRGEEYSGSQSGHENQLRVDDTYQQDQRHTEETYQPEERATEESFQLDEQANAANCQREPQGNEDFQRDEPASEATYQPDEEANENESYQQEPQATEENHQQEESEGTTQRYERDVGCQKDDMISDISDAENPPDETILSGSEHSGEGAKNQSMDHTAEDAAENTAEDSEIQEDRRMQADCDDKPEPEPEQESNTANEDEEIIETAHQEKEEDVVSKAASNDGEDVANNDEDGPAEEQTHDENPDDAENMKQQEESENAAEGGDSSVETNDKEDDSASIPIEEIPDQDGAVDANEFAERIIDENIGAGGGVLDSGHDNPGENDVAEKDASENDVTEKDVTEKDVTENDASVNDADEDANKVVKDEKGTEDKETNEDDTAETGQAEVEENTEAEKDSDKIADDVPDQEAEDREKQMEVDQGEAHSEMEAEKELETEAEKEPEKEVEKEAEKEPEKEAGIEAEPEVEEITKSNDSSKDIVVTGEEPSRPRRKRGVPEEAEIVPVDKDNDSGNDLVVTGVDLGRSRRSRRGAAEQPEVVEVDKDKDPDITVTSFESGRPRRGRASAAPASEESQPVVLGTVQSTTISTSDSENNGVTKWVVGADGNLVRMSEEDFPKGAPWTQLSFGQPAEGELEPPQSGYLIQIEDLRVGEETHEDVSDFLNIPEEAVELWRSSKKCPVSQCKGPALTLKHFFDWHWYVFHEQLIKVYYCPVSGCTRMKERWNTRRKRDLIAHLQQKHCVEQFPEAIETQIINNPNYKPPTNFVTLPRAAPKAKPPPPAAKKPAAPARKRAADLMNSVQGVQSEVVEEGIPEEYCEAWKRLKFCPCVGCGREKMQFMSEVRRHWKSRHVCYTTVYVCPDGDCQVKGRAKGQRLNFRTQNMPAMIKHLTSPAHLLTQTEAEQIGASLVPTQLDNPSYIELKLCPIKMAPPEPTPKKPKTVSKPVEKTPVNPIASRSSRRAAPAESPAKPEASPAIGGRHSRALNRAVQEVSSNSTISNSDTESLPDTRKRTRHERGNTDTPTEEPLTKRSRRDNIPEPQLQVTKKDCSGKFMSPVELDEFENAREEIIPNEFMEWWADRNGCPSTVCSASVCHFRVGDLIRHWKLRHLKKVPQYYCPIVSCDYNVKHKPSLKKHLASRHNTTPAAIESIIAKSKAELLDNSDYEAPIHPNKTKSPAKSPPKPKAAEIVTEGVSRSRSGKVISSPTVSTPRPGPKSRSMAKEVSPISAEVVIALPRVDATPVHSGRRSINRGPSQSNSGKSLEQLAWQPTVNIMALPKAFTTTDTVDVRSRAFRSFLSDEKRKPPPQPKKQSPAKLGPSSSKNKVAMPDVRFEADDEDTDNFGVDVPMPSMEDAGIAVSFFPHKSPGGKHSPGKKGTPASSHSLLQSPASDDVSDYRAALQALRERQMELERRLETSSPPTVNSDVLKKITDLQTQNEALRFQNEALRKQLKSGAMAKQWEEEKKELLQQVHNKDVTISTLQDVIARMGTTSSTSNTITNQMINLPGSRPNTRGAQNALAAPPGRLSIKPRAGTSRDGNFQQCSVALKSGAKVNFEYEDFGDFMQKIGTLNDQYGLNE